MPIVLDASVTMAWCFADEATAYTEAVFDRLRNDGAVVPAIWPLEVANVLLIGERRQRLSELQRVRFVHVLRALPITVDVGALSEAFGAVLAIGREHGLSAYDAAYLELAMREGLPLATQDERLVAVARLVGVTLVAKS